MTRAVCTVGIAAATLAVALVLPARAAAHPLVDEARSHLERAEFEQALEALEFAATLEDLGRPDVVELLELRAMAHVALADVQALQNDIAALASIDPSHVFPPEAPPELQGMLEERAAAAGPLAVTAHVAPTDAGVRIDASAQNDDASVVQRIRVFTRLPGAPFRELSPGETVGATEVEYYAEAVGIGGAVLASAGSSAVPRRWPAGSSSEPWFGDEGRQDDDESGGVGAWPFVLGGVAVVAVGVVLFLVLTGGSGGTQPEAPVVIGF